MTKKIQKTL